jgi:hypothetical protein
MGRLPPVATGKNRPEAVPEVDQKNQPLMDVCRAAAPRFRAELSQPHPPTPVLARRRCRVNLAYRRQRYDQRTTRVDVRIEKINMPIFCLSVHKYIETLFSLSAFPEPF